MFSFDISIPTELCFGAGRVRSVGKLMKKHADNVLLLYGSERIFHAGTGNMIVADLEDAGCNVVPRGGFPANTDSMFIDQAIRLVRERHIDGILAAGGGSVIDSAKAIAIGACVKESILQIFRDGAAVNCVLPIGVVVTVPATGSEANAVAVITDHDTHRKYTGRFPQAKPRFAILDPELTVSVPPGQTAIGGFDIFSHAFERFFDLTRDSLLLDEMTMALMRSVVQCLPKLVDEPENIDLRSEIMFAATVAHSDMIGPGGDFGCHALSHILTEAYGTPHGAGLAMLIPAWCRVMEKYEPARFEAFYRGVFGAEDAEEGKGRQADFVHRIKLPADLGGTGDPEMLTEVTLETGAAVGGRFRPMDKTDIRAVFELIR